MSMVKDAIGAMKDVLILTEKVEQAGKSLSEIGKELRDHDRRIVRLETYLEIAQRRLSGEGN